MLAQGSQQGCVIPRDFLAPEASPVLFDQFHWSFSTEKSQPLQTNSLNQKGSGRLLEVFASSGQRKVTNCPSLPGTKKSEIP